MLYDIAQIVQTELQSRGCPLPVTYGPERARDSAFVQSRVVFSRDRAQSESVGPPRTQRLNPPRRAERSLAGVVRVYAHSTVDGARVQDHERIADAAVDLIIVALQHAAAELRIPIVCGSGGFVGADDLDVAGGSTWAGVVYEMAISCQRAVYDRTWVGEARDEITDFSIVTSGTCVSTAAPDP